MFFFYQLMDDLLNTTQRHNHQHILSSGLGAQSNSAPPIRTNTAHFTQQSPRMDCITYYSLYFSGNSMQLNIYGLYIYNTCKVKSEV